MGEVFRVVKGEEGAHERASLHVIKNVMRRAMIICKLYLYLS